MPYRSKRIIAQLRKQMIARLLGETKSKKQNLVLFKHRAGEFSRSECARIYVDAIITDLGLAYWRMTVDHDFPKAALVTKKKLPDPEQVISALVGQCNSRPYTGMDKKIVA